MFQHWDFSVERVHDETDINLENYSSPDYCVAKDNTTLHMNTLWHFDCCGISKHFRNMEFTCLTQMIEEFAVHGWGREGTELLLMP